MFDIKLGRGLRSELESLPKHLQKVVWTTEAGPRRGEITQHGVTTKYILHYASPRLRSFSNLKSRMSATGPMAQPLLPDVFPVRFETGKYLMVTQILGSAKDLRSGPLPEMAADTFLYRLLQQYKTLHDAGFAHWDPSPGNVVSCSSNCLHLIDFEDLGPPNQKPTTDGTPWYRFPTRIEASGIEGKLCINYGVAVDLFGAALLTAQVALNLTHISQLFPVSDRSTWEPKDERRLGRLIDILSIELERQSCVSKDLVSLLRKMIRESASAWQGRPCTISVDSLLAHPALSKARELVYCLDQCEYFGRLHAYRDSSEDRLFRTDVGMFTRFVQSSVAAWSIPILFAGVTYAMNQYPNQSHLRNLEAKPEASHPPLATKTPFKKGNGHHGPTRK